jgi:hypothetical protein
LDLQLPMQSVPCEFESRSGDVYSIQHYVIKLASNLQQVGGFLWFPPPIKQTTTI